MLLTKYKALKQQIEARDAELANLKMRYDQQVAAVKAKYKDADSALEEMRSNMLAEMTPPAGQNIVISDPDGTIEITWRTAYDIVDPQRAIDWLNANGYSYAIKPPEIRKSEFNVIAKQRYEDGQTAPEGSMPEKKPVLTVRLT